MVQQGRLVAAALGDRRTRADRGGCGALVRLGRRGDARMRIYDAKGVLVADSVHARIWRPPERPLGSRRPATIPRSSGIRERLPLSRRRVDRARAVARPGQSAHTMLVVRAGRRQARARARATSRRGLKFARRSRDATAPSVRPTPGQRSLTLYSAVPIRHGDRVVGAALVSQSTFRILQALYEVRLRIFRDRRRVDRPRRSLGLLMSATIVRPLVRLRRTALALVGSPRRHRRAFVASIERTRSATWRARLEELTRPARRAHQAARVVRGRRIARVQESAGVDSHRRRGHRIDRRCRGAAAFSDMLTRDVDRLERLVSGVRELARIDAQLAHEAISPVDVSALVEARRRRLRAARRPRPVFVSRSAAAAATCEHHLIAWHRCSRTCSTTPPASHLPRPGVEVRRWPSTGVTCTVSDRGSGSRVSAGHVEPASSIVSSLTVPATAAGGSTRALVCPSRAPSSRVMAAASIGAANRAGGGASVEVPAADQSQAFSLLHGPFRSFQAPNPLDTRGCRSRSWRLRN